MKARFILTAAAVGVATGMGACDQPTPTAGNVMEEVTPALHAMRSYGEWAPVVRVEDIPGTHHNFNTPQLDGCPFISADGKTFFMASDRPGGKGGIDIWVSTRKSTKDPWGEPVNVGEPVNTPSNDFCPTLASDGRTFYFASNREGGCGGDDLYVTRRRGAKERAHDDEDDSDDSDDRNGSSDNTWAFETPRNLGCDLNSTANEAGPSPVYEPGVGLVLYFSSFRAGGFSPEPEGALSGDSDIYRSVWRRGGFGKAELVPGVNTPQTDGQPNIRHDARELFFFSNRPGAQGNDIYVTTRHRTRDVWSEPVNLGPNVNSEASETRPSLSWDGRTLYIGSDRVRPTAEGRADHYVTTRHRRSRGDD